MVLTQVMSHPHTNAVAIMGATAIGKSDLAIRLAERIDGEIISMDSRQVYRGLDIGTGKVPHEDLQRVPHHLIDILDPSELNTAGTHLARALEAQEAIRARGRIPVFAGGTGLYFRVLFRGLIDVGVPDDELRDLRDTFATRSTTELYQELLRLDPERAASLSKNDRQRIVRSLEIYHHTGKSHTRYLAEGTGSASWQGLKIVLTMPRPMLRSRVAERTRQMFDDGWVDEVKVLLARGITLDAPAMNSLGYDVIARAILKGEDPMSTVDSIITRTQQYAKRQETFFRSEVDALWFDVSDPVAQHRIEQRVREHLGL
ncbi:MAG: tRNA (adenosine(37)-N6)-dimethylallyltransferase MiaA [Candidatus Latescibacterota bacterium]|nr:MAG: tRNA (adenosine(37)-N6)-dimethylallyltransferase MiaA [Candidatus Latescibacterota bacterium]